MTDASKYAVKPDDWTGLSAQLGQETDRGAALVGAAFLENLLGGLLEEFMLDDPKHSKLLLEGPLAPFGTLYSRTIAAYSLGLISNDELNDLSMIREVRNTFAHSSKPIEFSSSELKPKLDNLLIPHLVPEDVLDTSELSPRQLFVNAVSMISTFLDRRRRAIDDRQQPAKKFYIQPLEDPR